MAATNSLRRVADFFQLFGLSPFRLRGSAFERSETRFRYSKVLISASATLCSAALLWFLLAVGLGHLPELGRGRFIIVFALVTSHASLPVIFNLVLTERDRFCHWLNRLSGLLASLPEGEVRKVDRFNAAALAVFAAVTLALATVQSLAPNEYLDRMTADERTWDVLAVRVSTVAFFFVEVENKLFLQYFLILVNMIRAYYGQTNARLRGGVPPGRRSKVWLRRVRELRSRELQVQGLLEFLHASFLPVVTVNLFWGFCCIFLHMLLDESGAFGLPQFVKVLWAVHVFWNCFTVAFMCDVTEKEAEKVVHHVQKLCINCDDFEVREEVELLSLQVQHQKVEFYTRGNVKINLTLIYTMIGSLISYGVIFIQFQEGDFGGGVCYKRTPINCSASAVGSPTETDRN